MPSPWDKLWPPERTARLVALVAQGYSGRQIAAVLGVTRNAVIGKAHRIGLNFTGEAREPAAIRRLIKRVTVKPLRRPPPPPAPEVSPANGPIGIMELTAFTCRWPIGERPPYRYCGTTKPAEMAYCRKHTEIAVGHHHRQDVSGSGSRNHAARECPPV